MDHACLHVVIVTVTIAKPEDRMLHGNHWTATLTEILVEDIIREKFYIHLNQELPYIIRQVITV